MKCILVVLLCSIHLCCAATNIDSLKQIAFNPENNDTVRTRALNSIAFDGFIYQNIDSTRHYANKAIKLSESFNYKMGIADATKTLGDSYLVGGGYDEAVPYYEKALALFTEIKSPKGEAYLLNNLAGIYQYQGKLDEAIDMYIRSLDINEQLGNETIFSQLYHNIATIHQTLNQDKKAKSYAKKAIKADGNKRVTAKANLMLAILNMKNDKLDSTLVYIENAEDIANEIGNDNILVEAYITKGEMYSHQGELSEAVLEWEKALPIALTLDDKQYLSRIQIKLALQYKNNGSFKKAVSFFESALQNAESIAIQNDIQCTLYECYKTLKNTSKSLFYLEKCHASTDSLFNVQQVEKIAEIETKYQTEKKELENQNLLTTNQFINKQNKQFKIGGSVLLLLSSLLGYLYVQLTKTKNKLSVQNVALSKLNETKDTFFGIIAHDLRSPLTALSGSGSLMKTFIKRGHEKQVNALADQLDITTNKLTSLLDNLLNWALLQKGTIPYKPEQLNIHKSLMEIIELFENNAQLKLITIKNQIDSTSKAFVDQSAFNTIFRNLIHNAIKFSHEGGEINIRSEVENDMIKIQVIDNGIGMSKAQIKSIVNNESIQSKGTDGESGTGLGLTLVKQLVELNKGAIDIQGEKNKGTQINLHLPLRQ